LRRSLADFFEADEEFGFVFESGEWGAAEGCGVVGEGVHLVDGVLAGEARDEVRASARTSSGEAAFVGEGAESFHDHVEHDFHPAGTNKR
jgi:hypothetical protein